MDEWLVSGGKMNKLLVDEWQEKQRPGQRGGHWCGIGQGHCGDLLGGNSGEREVVHRPSA